MEKIGDLINELNDFPDEVDIPKNILILDKNIRQTILTKPRLEIINFLKQQNPVTVEEVVDLFGENTKKDLIILNQINLILLESKTEIIDKDTIVKLNREITIYPKC